MIDSCTMYDRYVSTSHAIMKRLQGDNHKRESRLSRYADEAKATKTRRGGYVAKDRAECPV